MNKAKNTFTTLQYNIADLKNDEYDLSDSDGYSRVNSFFLFKDNYHCLESKDNTPKHNLL